MIAEKDREVALLRKQVLAKQEVDKLRMEVEAEAEAEMKRRIAKGSGTTVMEVNELLSQFRQMQRMMKQLTGGGKHGRGGRRGLMSMLGGLGQ